MKLYFCTPFNQSIPHSPPPPSNFYSQILFEIRKREHFPRQPSSRYNSSWDGVIDAALWWRRSQKSHQTAALDYECWHVVTWMCLPVINSSMHRYMHLYYKVDCSVSAHVCNLADMHNSRGHACFREQGKIHFRSRLQCSVQHLHLCHRGVMLPI